MRGIIRFKKNGKYVEVFFRNLLVSFFNPSIVKMKIVIEKQEDRVLYGLKSSFDKKVFWLNGGAS